MPTLPGTLWQVLALALAAADSRPGPRDGPADVREAMERLASPDATDRIGAERWLAVHLDPEDLPVVAELASGAELEVRARLEQAIGSDDRHFALAALLASEYDPVLRRLGEGALAEMAARFYGDGELQPVRMEAALGILYERYERPFRLRPDFGSLDESLDRLARLVPAPVATDELGPRVGLVLDPGLYVADLRASRRRSPGEGDTAREIEGPYGVLLLGLVRTRGFAFEGFGFDGAHPWLRVMETADQARTSGVELLVRWSRQVLEYPDRPKGSGAARALAASGWPAPLEWLAERWTGFGDRNALDGLLVAAGRGRVVPALATGPRVARLLEDADRALVEGGAAGLVRAASISRALSAMGSTGSDGADLAAVVAAGYDDAGPTRRRLRLEVLAGMGRAPDALRARLAAELEGAEPSAALAILRTLAATRLGAGRSAEPTVRITDPVGVLRAASDSGLLREVLDDLRSLRVEPPPEWVGAAGDALAPRVGHVAVVWWLGVEGGLEPAARFLVRSATDLKRERLLGQLLSEELGLGRRARVEAVFARARELGGADLEVALDRLAALAFVLEEERHAGLFARLDPDRSEDLPVLASLAVGPVEKEVEEVLVDAVRAGLGAGGGIDAPWVQAVERAALVLRRSGGSADLARLRTRLEAVFQGRSHPLGRDLDRGRWPRGTGRAPSLERLDGRF